MRNKKRFVCNTFCRLLHLRTAIALLIAFSLVSGANGQALLPGVYGPFDNGVQEWTPSLVPVTQFVLGPSGGMSGAAISRDGLFLTQFYNNSSPPYGPELLAINNKGAIVRSMPVAENSLSRGSGIVVIPGSGNILLAAGTSILEITPNFSSATALPITFGDVAGLALGKDGTLYAVDSNANHIDVINPQFTAVTTTIPTNQTPIGLALGPDNAIYYTDEPYVSGTYLSRMVRVDLANNYDQSVVLSGLPFLADLTFAPDGSFYLGESSGRSLAHYSFGGTLLQQVSGTNVVDGVAVVVAPEPASLSILLLAVPLLRRRTR